MFLPSAIATTTTNGILTSHSDEIFFGRLCFYLVAEFLEFSAWK